MRPTVDSFFDEATNTVSHIVADPATGKAAIIDSVLDFDSASGRTDTASADKLIAHIKAKGLTVEWVLETHIHADHLTAAPYLLERLGGSLGVGGAIAQVQRTFGEIFNVGPGFARDGSQFHRLFRDGETFRLGDIEVRAIHTPGHTPACMTYVIGDAAFVGDTLFMPDYGTARCDFPGGDARQLYRSIQKIFALPPETRLFLCHDYKAPGRDEYRWETSVAEERASNIHVHNGVTEEDFVAMRTARDATLSMPRLILPSVQVNMRAGHFPPAEENGVSYLKLPLNAL
ncbi:MBL fold metallo-hydrolase [Oceanibaculum sp.]|uniref:MBL fold metallo-hydrolase n=1 Tax=Oceanibaculum sp. TaxID=1903597 RepID=UPI002584F7C8|nr:MBL fold metallo-hydrolase [Oceanibaculum sp.]MCH2394181.1 MBL fold metallo-hydrolase [Oceanibaculum sp.]